MAQKTLSKKNVVKKPQKLKNVVKKPQKLKNVVKKPQKLKNIEKKKKKLKVFDRTSSKKNMVKKPQKLKDIEKEKKKLKVYGCLKVFDMTGECYPLELEKENEGFLFVAEVQVKMANILLPKDQAFPTLVTILRDDVPISFDAFNFDWYYKAKPKDQKDMHNCNLTKCYPGEGRLQAITLGHLLKRKMPNMFWCYAALTGAHADDEAAAKRALKRMDKGGRTRKENRDLQRRAESEDTVLNDGMDHVTLLRDVMEHDRFEGRQDFDMLLFKLLLDLVNINAHYVFETGNARDWPKPVVRGKGADGSEDNLLLMAIRNSQCAFRSENKIELTGPEIMKRGGNFKFLNQINTRYGSETSLTYLARNHLVSRKHVKFLVEYKANLEEPDGEGVTALGHAISSRNHHQLIYLLGFLPRLSTQTACPKYFGKMKFRPLQLSKELAKYEEEEDFFLESSDEGSGDWYMCRMVMEAEGCRRRGPDARVEEDEPWG